MRSRTATTYRSHPAGPVWDAAPRATPLPPPLALLVVGCLTLGTGVAMLLTADLGSDGFSTLVNGVSIGGEMPFLVANLVISVGFLVIAAVRRVLARARHHGADRASWASPSSWLLPVLDTPEPLVGQVVLLVAAFPVLALGIAVYLGTHLGAGPAEAAALAWDPPVPFRGATARSRAAARWSAGCSAPRSGRAPWR